jgi:hypothetical protein
MFISLEVVKGFSSGRGKYRKSAFHTFHRFLAYHQKTEELRVNYRPPTHFFKISRQRKGVACASTNGACVAKLGDDEPLFNDCRPIEVQSA